MISDSRTFPFLPACLAMALLSSPVRADLGVPVSPPAPLNANAAGDSGYENSPRIVTDGHGHWVAAWRSVNEQGGPFGTDIDVFVARSIDGRSEERRVGKGRRSMWSM